MSDAAAPPRIDGRTARAERSRRAIVEAHLALLNEGDLKPTGERIADRAGVSLRALWTNYKDMETLLGATAERVLQLMDDRYVPVRTDLPLPRRVDEFCRQRARLLELLAPAARASQLKEPFSAHLRQARSRHIARVRRELEQLFGPELESAGPAREQILAGLTVAATFAGWQLLRDELGLDVDAARAVLARTVNALLAAALTAAG
jgi:TetR/AcrR family transcriptional regulator of autoinduction and epiphytic fitness